jgi:sulfhydrogenase subunit gamma (sulfur reductase)
MNVLARAQMETHPLPVVAVKQIAARQVLLTLDGAGAGAAESYTVPGQYMRLAIEEGVARPYAIASPPGLAQLEFLLKVPAERVGPLCALGPGDRVQATHAQGKGFPLDKARGKALWLFASGSGVAPLRAVVERVAAQRSEFGDVTLLYGVKTQDELAFTERFGAWAGLGVAVQPVLSRAINGWDGRRGYVQDHIPKTFAHPEQIVAFVCGLPEMDKAVAAALLERGVVAVFRNF